MAARFGWALALALLLTAPAAAQTSIILDDFNVDEGHFNRSPGFSGSSNGFQKLTAEYTTPPPEGTNPNPSTADRDTTMALEGAGSEKIVLFDDLDATTLEPTGGSARLRFLSGTGTTTNNTPFSTTLAGTDGWIGFALKTDAPGWTTSLWIELAPPGTDAATNNNAGIPKDVIADGEWHIYEWNLDDIDGTAGDGNGWTSVAGIIAGSATVAEGNHTIDSIVFRNTETPASSTIYLDFVALNRNGSIADIVPEGVAGDLDGDSDVDGNDFLLWQRRDPPDAEGLATFQQNFGGAPSVSAIPEPASLALAGAALVGGLALRRRRK